MSTLISNQCICVRAGLSLESTTEVPAPHNKMFPARVCACVVIEVVQSPLNCMHIMCVWSTIYLHSHYSVIHAS